MLKRKNIILIGWQMCIALAGISILAFFLLIPTPRQFGLSLRYDFLIILAAIGLVVFLVLKLSGKISDLLLFIFTSFIFVLPISGLWFSGQSEQYVLGGIIPFSDARNYFMDSRRLLEGFQFVTGAARRPLFTALLTSIQWITGQNLYLTIAVLTFILVVTIYLSVLEIKSIEGPAAATFFLLLLFFYSRLLLGKTLSEMVGLPLGLLALIFLLRGPNNNRLIYLLAGLFLLSLALNARAGAFVILPLIALWIGWIERRNSFFHWQAFLIACMVFALGFVINLGIFNLYASPQTVPFGNFSNTIYGLARGGLGWTQIFTDHPETWGMPADKQASYIYSLTLEIIQRKPENLIKGILSSYQVFFSLDDYYGSIGWFGGQGTIGNIARIVLYLLFIVGIFKCIKNFKKPIYSLVLAASVGIFLSIPFAPPIDSNRMRVYAATIPFFIIIPCFGVSFLLNLLPWKFFNNQDSQPHSLIPIYILSTALFLFMTILPLVPLQINKHDNTPSINCPPELTQVSFRILPGNYIRIVEQESIPQDRVPEIKEKSFITRVHNLPNWETFPLFTSVKPGQVILADLDLKTTDGMILIADWQNVAKNTAIQTVCARYADDKLLTNYNVFYAEEYVPQ
jgi:hypothetical protein